MARGMWFASIPTFACDMLRVAMVFTINQARTFFDSGFAKGSSAKKLVLKQRIETFTVYVSHSRSMQNLVILLAGHTIWIHMHLLEADVSIDGCIYFPQSSPVFFLLCTA